MYKLLEMKRKREVIQGERWVGDQDSQRETGGQRQTEADTGKAWRKGRETKRERKESVQF